MEIIWYISCDTVIFHTSKLQELQEYKNQTPQKEKTPPINPIQNKHNGNKMASTVLNPPPKITFQDYVWEIRFFYLLVSYFLH